MRRAIADRQDRADVERMTHKPIAAGTPWTDYTVTSQNSGKSYRVSLRGVAGPVVLLVPRLSHQPARHVQTHSQHAGQDSKEVPQRATRAAVSPIQFFAASRLHVRPRADVQCARCNRTRNRFDRWRVWQAADAERDRSRAARPFIGTVRESSAYLSRRRGVHRARLRQDRLARVATSACAWRPPAAKCSVPCLVSWPRWSRAPRKPWRLHRNSLLRFVATYRT